MLNFKLIIFMTFYAIGAAQGRKILADDNAEEAVKRRQEYERIRQ